MATCNKSSLITQHLKNNANKCWYSSVALFLDSFPSTEKKHNKNEAKISRIRALPSCSSYVVHTYLQIGFTFRHQPKNWTTYGFDVLMAPHELSGSPKSVQCMALGVGARMAAEADVHGNPYLKPAIEKIRGSAELLGYILWEPWTSTRNLMTIHLVTEIFWPNKPTCRSNTVPRAAPSLLPN